MDGVLCKKKHFNGFTCLELTFSVVIVYLIKVQNEYNFMLTYYLNGNNPKNIMNIRYYYTTLVIAYLNFII